MWNRVRLGLATASIISLSAATAGAVVPLPLITTANMATQGAAMQSSWTLANDTARLSVQSVTFASYDGSSQSWTSPSAMALTNDGWTTAKSDLFRSPSNYWKRGRTRLYAAPSYLHEEYEDASLDVLAIKTASGLTDLFDKLCGRMSIKRCERHLSSLPSHEVLTKLAGTATPKHTAKGDSASNYLVAGYGFPKGTPWSSVITEIHMRVVAHRMKKRCFPVRFPAATRGVAKVLEEKLSEGCRATR